ncbi:MAG TPA: hypothetical protein VGL02_29120, partial [Streptomyces sp.]
GDRLVQASRSRTWQMGKDAFFKGQHHAGEAARALDAGDIEMAKGTPGSPTRSPGSRWLPPSCSPPTATRSGAAG